jgi:hypothetical protein
MADRVEQSGSWAQSDVIDVLQANGILPSNANEGIALAVKGEAGIGTTNCINSLT